LLCANNKKRKFDGALQEGVDNGQPRKHEQRAKRQRRSPDELNSRKMEKLKLKEEKMKRKEERKSENAGSDNPMKKTDQNVKQHKKDKHGRCHKREDSSKHKLEKKQERMARKEEKLKAKQEAAAVAAASSEEPMSDNNGQTHSLVSEFQQLALSAYPADVVEKIRSKKFAKIILDGNNMMFITDGLRKNTLSHKRVLSEKLLSIAALAFSKHFGVNTEIVFDTTLLPSSGSFTAGLPLVGHAAVVPGSGNTFEISSARPLFKTTDDRLISFARTNLSVVAAPSSAGPTPNADIVVVSSDRALAGELSSLGMFLMKPMVWVSLFVSAIVKPQNMPVDAENGGKRDNKEMAKHFDQWCSEQRVE